MQKNIKWKTLIALVMVYVSIIFNQAWLIGLLFVFWTLQSLKNKQAFIIEEIRRDNNPILYWIIVLTWVFVALFYFDFTKDFIFDILY